MPDRSADLVRQEMLAFRLRDATEEDAELIQALTLAAYAEYREVLAPASGVFSETPETVRAWLARGGVVVAEAGDGPIGCVRWRAESDPPHLYVGRLAVLPRSRRAGVGEALLHACEARSIALGLDEVRLGVRVALPHLKAWYERLGYEACAFETREPYGVFAVWMRRSVAKGATG